ncbi:MAG: LexA family transcriptional regulator [Alphaproteobacteria bacterium]|nr:LexA family transcriptional regulator [Alphaproteobacteria bacterium]
MRNEKRLALRAQNRYAMRMMRNLVSHKLKALRQSAGLSIRAVSEALGWSLSSYSHYELRFNGEYLPVDKAHEIASALAKHGVDPADVLALAGIAPIARPSTSDASASTDRDSCEQDDTAIHVPAYDLGLSAGPGTWCENDPEPAWMESFDRRWLRRITSAQPNQLVLVLVSGDSMEPTLRDGDQILVDRSVNAVSRDGVYAVRFNDNLLVKRITVDIRSGHFTVASDNTRYDSFHDVQSEELRIIGIVVWAGRRM